MVRLAPERPANCRMNINAVKCLLCRDLFQWDVELENLRRSGDGPAPERKSQSREQL